MGEEERRNSGLSDDRTGQRQLIKDRRVKSVSISDSLSPANQLRGIFLFLLRSLCLSSLLFFKDSDRRIG